MIKFSVSLLLFYQLMGTSWLFGQNNEIVQDEKEEPAYVVLGFSVNPSTGVRDVYVMKGVSPAIDQAAIRFVQEKTEVKAARSASYFLPVKMNLQAARVSGLPGYTEEILDWEKGAIQPEIVEQIQKGPEWVVDFYLAAVITGIDSKRLQTKVFNQLWIGSSVIPGGGNHKSLLQLCFDTNELYARKLKKKIKKSKLKSIYADVVKLKEIEMELKGERDFRIIKILKETGYGSKQSVLAEWQQQIEKELNKLLKYK